jgi:aminoglycoside phosphotransferase family enzyme
VQIESIVSKNVDIQFRQKLREALKWNERFLKKHAGRFHARIDRGFKRDVHGDLHSGNIFLYKKPILFDCIEFNDSFRQIDVLYEVAFLCMDLEGYGMKDLANKFLQTYNSIFESFEVYEDFEIFNYFKCLRANIRAKVNALAAVQAENEQDIRHHVEEMKKFLELMHSYVLADDSVLSFR